MGYLGEGWVLHYTATGLGYGANQVGKAILLQQMKTGACVDTQAYMSIARLSDREVQYTTRCDTCLSSETPAWQLMCCRCFGVVFPHAHSSSSSHATFHPACVQLHSALYHCRALELHSAFYVGSNFALCCRRHWIKHGLRGVAVAVAAPVLWTASCALTRGIANSWTQKKI